jgi:O-antigen/teichoic acid export membrane protein
LKKILYRNSIVGVIQVVLTTVLTFLGLHFFISKLGDDVYGVFALISVIGNLNIFANLGLNYSLIKFLSEQGNTIESNWDIIISISILIAIVIPFSIIFLLFDNFIIFTIFNIPITYIESAKLLYKFLILSNILMLIGQLFSSVFDAIQKIYITNLLQMIYSTLYWILIIIVLSCGYSLNEIGFCIFISTAIWFILTIYYFAILWGKLEYEGIKFHIKRLSRKHLSYSFNIYLSGTLNFFYEPLTKLLISNYLGINYVGYFDIALKIITLFWSFIAKILYPLN